MNKNIKIAKQLIEIAKSLIAFRFLPDTSLNDKNKMLHYVPSSFSYFGNSIDTVKTDQMWDENSIAKVILNSSLLPAREVVKNIKNGDRHIPSKLIRWIRNNQDKLDDMSEIVCGVNELQRIAFIYINDFDIHYFFDV